MQRNAGIQRRWGAISERTSVKKSELLPGDHICVKRKRKFYTHHGIYAGDGKVIHFSGSMREKKDPQVRETDLSRFLRGGKLKRCDYDRRLTGAETAGIARGQLHNGGYSMLWNNCEHFAAFCATGKKRSRQVRKVFGSLGAVGTGIALFIIRIAVSKTLKQP